MQRGIFCGAQIILLRTKQIMPAKNNSMVDSYSISNNNNITTEFFNHLFDICTNKPIGQ